MRCLNPLHWMEEINMERMVFFHKTPALWNKDSDLSKEPSNKSISKMKQQFSKNNLDPEISDFLSTDVYVKICKMICEELGIEELHIVHGFMKEEKRNWSVGEKKGWSKVDQNTTYWSLTSPEELLGFMDSSLIFTRGNYATLHGWLKEYSSYSNSQFWFHYPATSLRFPHLDHFESSIKDTQGNHTIDLSNVLEGMKKEHNLSIFKNKKIESLSDLISCFDEKRNQKIGGPYSLVLSDDKKNVKILEKAFPESRVQTFTKPAIWDSEIKSTKRRYDLIYCGTTLQVTKNHHCFIQLLKYLDIYSDVKLNVVIAGNKEESTTFSSLFNHPFSNIEIFDKGEVSRKELQSLFLQSKTMLVTSGRDSNPRVIQESLVHGSRVLAINSLSDGLDFLNSNPLLGSVLFSNPELWNYTRNGNLEFKPSMYLASLIANEIQRSNFPDLVMRISRKKLSVDESVKSLITTIRSFR